MVTCEMVEAFAAANGIDLGDGFAGIVGTLRSLEAGEGEFPGTLLESEEGKAVFQPLLDEYTASVSLKHQSTTNTGVAEGVATTTDTTVA